MKKLYAALAGLALLLTGCAVPQTYDGYVHAECGTPTQQAEGEVTNCSVTEKPLPTSTATVTQDVPGPTVTQTVPGPTVTVTQTVTPTPTATTTTPPATTEKRYTGFVTGFSYFDNDPPNSTAIAYENAFTGRTGAGGTGTYANPVTVAVPSVLADGTSHAPGDRFYLPNLRRYFVVEDLCAVSHSAPNGCTSQFDVWVDGRWNNTAANNCMNAITGNHLIIKNPAQNYRVAAGVIAPNNCTEYGDSVLTQ